jgi:endonuclease YncB( thermonuclease family)
VTLALDPRAVTKPPADQRLYVYRAVPARWEETPDGAWSPVDPWVDGDTCWVMLDWGGRAWYHGPARIAHINAPERHGATFEAGEAARAHAAELWPAWTVRTVRVNGLEKFGRLLLEVAFGADFLGLAKAMIADGYAVAYEGGPR